MAIDSQKNTGNATRRTMPVTPARHRAGFFIFKGQMPLQIEYIALDKLLPYARNSRTHSDEQVAQIAASIKEFGFTNPLLIGEDGVIIAGHGRLAAARKLSMAEVPCIRLEGLSEAQKRALVIADNRIAENAGWDEEMLAVELADLQADGFDLDLLGFDADELASILSADEPIPLQGVDAIKEECNIVVVCRDWNEREMAISRLGGRKIGWDDLEGLLR